jgi:hypothetical protein
MAFQVIGIQSDFKKLNVHWNILFKLISNVFNFPVVHVIELNEIELCLVERLKFQLKSHFSENYFYNK